MTSWWQEQGAQLVSESKALHHCVGNGSYHERIAKEQSLIVLVKKTKKPYFTIEISIPDTKILQIRGKSNKKPSDDLKKVVEMWMDYVKKQTADKKETIREAI